LYCNNSTQQWYDSLLRKEGRVVFFILLFIKNGFITIQKKRFDLLILKKITAAGKDPVTTVPAAISILLLIMRKNINTILSSVIVNLVVERVSNVYNQATKTL